MSDVLKRLRELQRLDEAGEKFGFMRDIWKSAADEIDRLQTVAIAARKMPRWTPKGGAASTKHIFQIAACDVWALDAALKALDR